ncbi:MAG: SRPBCC family protein [Theionarchaea archaeon]|nr:SRPBCC family protein [Theionarchaea archaeon]MBU7000433.1 SRPBCC family protein [Theionarchaea archaeon]MBU7021276.1 SRPBCC family protein [Theionarchaea archaeon]MBU7036045.1 SRPBCC family protein [Theionarchaea archaeon]MBU7039767.1 SRPBCC family protein [Theionarchaea archaeon]
MARIEKTSQVKAPVEKVFALCSDIEGYTKFMQGAKEIKMTGDKTAHWTMEMAGRAMEFDTEMTENIENEKIAWKSMGDFVAAGSWSLKPAGQATEIEMVMDYDIPGVLGKLFDKIKISKEMEKNMESSLERMKKILE